MPSHPIHKMLKEHLRFIISIDTLGRDILIKPGGSADRSLTVGHGSDGIKKLLQKTFKNMKWEDFDYKQDLKKRGVMDLPGYHHRDDCLQLWDVIKKYVEGMVKAFYEDDNAVMKDYELQIWAKDVCEKGFEAFPDIGLPTELKSIDELVN